MTVLAQVPAGLCGSSSTLPAPGCRTMWRRLPSGPGLKRPDRGVVVANGLGDLFKGITDFESWAPRSSRTWRLQKPDKPAEGVLKEEDIEVLNQRLAGARRSSGSEGGLGVVDPQGAAGEQEAGEQLDEDEQQWQAQQRGEDLFTRSTDEDLADSLNRRIVEVAPSLNLAEELAAPSQGSEAGEGIGSLEGEVLTGTLLRELCYAKYGKTYDMAFVRRDLPLGKTLVCLNILWTHLEQKSFPMKEFQYQEKLDGIAGLLRAWGQDEKVMAFMKSPAKPRKGLPGRPIVGTAISIQLDLDQSVIDEWFPSR